MFYILYIYTSFHALPGFLIIPVSFHPFPMLVVHERISSPSRRKPPVRPMTCWTANDVAPAPQCHRSSGFSQEKSGMGSVEFRTISNSLNVKLRRFPPFWCFGAVWRIAKEIPPMCWSFGGGTQLLAWKQHHQRQSHHQHHWDHQSSLTQYTRCFSWDLF